MQPQSNGRAVQNYTTHAGTAYREAISLSKAGKKAKYLNNLSLLFGEWPDETRLAEGLQLCDEIARVDPDFQWTEKTRAELERRLR